MGDAEVRPDAARCTSDSSKSCVGVRRRVEAERLACRPTTAVAMHCRVLPSPCTMPMPNLANAPSRAISSVAIWPVLRKATECGPCCALDRLQPVDRTSAAPCPSRPAPIGRRHSVRSGRHGPVGRLQHRQRFPALGAGHPGVDRVVDRRRQSNGRALLQVNIQAAAGRTKAADGSCHGVRLH